MLPLWWTNRSYAPIRKLRVTLDYAAFAAALEEAIVKSKYLAILGPRLRVWSWGVWVQNEGLIWRMLTSEFPNSLP